MVLLLSSAGCREYEKIVGVWTDTNRDSLCVFCWQTDRIEGTRLFFDSMTDAPVRVPFCSLSSKGQVSMDLQPNSRNCWLKEYNLAGGKLVKASSQNAEAAAAVAIGRHNVKLLSDICLLGARQPCMQFWPSIFSERQWSATLSWINNRHIAFRLSRCQKSLFFYSIRFFQRDGQASLSMQILSLSLSLLDPPLLGMLLMW